MIQLSRMYKLKNLPAGMQPIVSTGDDDCQFNSVGIALYGREEMAPVLRLGSKLAAIDHVQHFVKDVSLCGYISLLPVISTFPWSCKMVILDF